VIGSIRLQVVAKVAREVYRRELLPERVLWWMAAEGMRDWYRILAKRLGPHLERAAQPSARAVLADASARTFDRRGRVLGISGRSLGLLMSALYRIDRAPRAAWIFDRMGGPAHGAGEHVRARLLLARLGSFERWNEVATHLGELLVVLTEDLPKHLEHSRKILGDICFDAGRSYAERMKRVLHLPERPADPPRAAMEILRTSEYVFRVNPEHWSASDGAAGWLEGTACPWYERPGWNGGHCGIFGQFQSGISSVFGLRYQLSKTIPKHGGHTCRIDVKPIQLRRKEASA
jgi:hypothetical protein